MTATPARPRIRPTVRVLPDPSDVYPQGHVVVSPVVLPTYAGRWGVAGTAHAGMWVVRFTTLEAAQAAAARLRLTGHIS